MIVLIPNLILVDDGMRRAAERFKPAFHETWRLVPSEAQLGISKYLEQKPGHIYLCYKLDLYGTAEEPWGRSLWYDDRTVFTFLAPFIEHVERIEGATGVIGHELAHCY